MLYICIVTTSDAFITIFSQHWDLQLTQEFINYSQMSPRNIFSPNTSISCGRIHPVLIRPNNFKIAKFSSFLTSNIQIWTRRSCFLPKYFNNVVFSLGFLFDNDYLNIADLKMFEYLGRHFSRRRHHFHIYFGMFQIIRFWLCVFSFCTDFQLVHPTPTYRPVRNAEWFPPADRSRFSARICPSGIEKISTT